MLKRYGLVILVAGLLAGCQTSMQSVAVGGGDEPADSVRMEAVADSGMEQPPTRGLGAADDVKDNDVPAVESGLETEDALNVCEVPVDPETLEDMELLSDVDKKPPEDEGDTAVERDPVYDLPVVENDKVRYFIDYYTKRGSRGFRRWLERSGRYLPMMQAVFAEEGLPLDLAYLAMIESGFNVKACSRANAVGPWQFIASTGKMYDLHNEWWRDERRDPVKATRAAARHLRDLHARFNGDWPLAIAAYNAGPGKVSQAIRRTGSRDFWKISRGKHLRAETRNYLPKLFAVLHIAKSPAKYGFENLRYQAPLVYDEVALPSSTDLDIVARLCDVKYEDIQNLNPELKRWCTPPGIKNYRLRIPAGKREAFMKAYAKIPANRRANYRHYRVRSGDTLGALAVRYGIRSRDIMLLNRIKNPRALRIGSDLILPLRRDYSKAPVAALGDDYVRSKTRSYKVRNGDSLWRIARRFNVSTAQLAAWNGMAVNGVLRPGKVLKVAGGASRKLVLTGTYRVRSGDNLWTIARKRNVTVSQLCAWNGLSKNSLLKPGMVLKLAAAGGSVKSRKIIYKVRSGDSLWSISRRFDLAIGKICSLNNLGRKHVLQPGQKLTLLVGDDHRG
ncbi:lytic transglycosylase, SLT, LysM, LysM, LysM and LysM domain-containing [Syntrophotalea carbinolica DSM 2380]|uniref:Lytic transglycosylase, SLT, LysM, LysM, LysM and LysM domain-containing n=1 Tax=Syntrophotalea carbinolica (strain DSM 2380 / NBRC 103641 / GraBd1) TaxID=338963 RepID=Q3A2X4_SYNC1|nr:lytic transglycosylase, SLT, LysM, LysM, LysM and LysM domain-containing [Syntrophotalea carbinolica DSM 2380]